MGKQRLSGVWVVAVLAMALGGCTRAARVQIPIEGVKLAPVYGTTVEVSNWNGSVTVVADPTVKEARVTARVRGTDRVEDWSEGELAAQTNIKAVATVGPSGRLLRVTSVPATDPPRNVAVDLTVRIAKVSETRIRNSGGSVDVVRVQGPITVDNGVGGTPGGDIQVRTGAAMTAPITLTTTGGQVIYQVGPGSTGRFQMTADKGPPPQFSARIGSLADVRPEMQRYTCVFNDGANPVVIHSGDGLVRAAVMVDAGEYGPELWDGNPVWPKTPRIVGRLGGYYNDEPAKLPRRRKDVP